jgi:hypothetical protein
LNRRHAPKDEDSLCSGSSSFSDQKPAAKPTNNHRLNRRLAPKDEDSLRSIGSSRLPEQKPVSKPTKNKFSYENLMAQLSDNNDETNIDGRNNDESSNEESSDEESSNDEIQFLGVKAASPKKKAWPSSDEEKDEKGDDGSDDNSDVVQVLGVKAASPNKNDFCSDDDNDSLPPPPFAKKPASSVKPVPPECVSNASLSKSVNPWAQSTVTASTSVSRNTTVEVPSVNTSEVFWPLFKDQIPTMTGDELVKQNWVPPELKAQIELFRPTSDHISPTDNARNKEAVVSPRTYVCQPLPGQAATWIDW